MMYHTHPIDHTTRRSALEPGFFGSTFVYKLKFDEGNELICEKILYNNFYLKKKKGELHLKGCFSN